MKIEAGKVYQYKPTLCRACANLNTSEANNGRLFQTIERAERYSIECLEGDWDSKVLIGAVADLDQDTVSPGVIVSVSGCCLHPLDDIDEETDEMTDQEIKQCEPILL